MNLNPRGESQPITFTSATAPLAHYNWKYEFEPGVFGTVNLHESGRISLSAGPGSNGMGGQWQLSEDQKTINTSYFMMTMMMPPPHIRAREVIFSSTFGMREELPFELNMLVNPPTLTVPRRVIEGESPQPPLVLTGVMTEERQFAGAEQIQGFYDLRQKNREIDPKQWEIRKVTYLDESFVKSQCGEWSDFDPSSIAQIQELEDQNEYRVRTREYVKDGQTVGKLFDMFIRVSFTGKIEDNKKR